LSAEAVERQQALLQRFGLPTSLGSNLRVSPARISSAMELDKKVKGKAIHWVLLDDIGRAVVCDDVPPREVLGVLREIAES